MNLYYEKAIIIKNKMEIICGANLRWQDCVS